MKKIVRSILESLGYMVIQKETFAPEDLREKITNPILAKYYARKYSFSINADVNDCIMYWKFSCSKDSDNPLINTAVQYLQRGNVNYQGSLLERYYNIYQPKNVAQLFNLEGDLHSNLIDLPAHYFAYPWEDFTMREKEIGFKKATKRVTKERGNELSIYHGSGLFGPASKKRGELEIKILVDLVESIKKNNYIRSDDPIIDIIASILVDGNDYKYLITDGAHRISALSALDYKKVTIRVIPRGVPNFIYRPRGLPAFIYRSDVEYWPNVRRGLYNKQQALKIFDKMFQGEGLETTIHSEREAHNRI